jgi:hypothetical protein
LKPGSSVHAGLLMVSLKPFELRDYHLAGRGQRLAVLAWEGARQEHLGKASIRSRRLIRIVNGGKDQVANHFSCVLDALSWDAAAMSIAQEEATRLRKQPRIGGLGHTDAKEEEQGGCDGKG